MATTVTKISDVIVPELFTAYVIEKTAEKSNILNSGIAIANPKLNELVTAGGLTINMPFWQDLAGDDEVLSDSTPLTPGKITASKDIAALLMRGKAWGANELAGALAGDDPMAAIADRVSDYWARKEQKVLVSVLKGVFASAKMADHLLDKSSTPIDGKLVLDGKQLLGDSADKLQAIMMHSAVYTELQKQNLIQYTTVQGASGSPIRIPTYLTYNVVVDDAMPVEGIYAASKDTSVQAGKTYYTKSGNEYTAVAAPTGNPSTSSYYEKTGDAYTTYLFARGVIGRGEGTPVSLTPTETDRDSLAGEDYLINRRAFVMHPMGIKWIGNPAGTTPSNTELATGTNWERVYEPKNIGMVAIKHTI